LGCGGIGGGGGVSLLMRSEPGKPRVWNQKIHFLIAYCNSFRHSQCMRKSFIALFMLTGLVRAELPPMTAEIDWEKFLSRHDMVWNRMAEPWFQSPFIGNGELGSIIRAHSPELVHLDVGSSLVHDHRADDLRNGRVPDSVEVHHRGRLPIGHFELKYAMPIDREKSTARVNLWNAEVTGEWDVSGDQPATWRGLAHAVENVILYEFHGAPDALPAIQFVPAEARNPRGLPGSLGHDWKHNPPVEIETSDEGGVAHQKLVAGGETVTAWRIVRSQPGVLRLFWTVAHTHPEENAVSQAMAALDKATSTGFNDWIAAHRAWWHAYYPQSFLTFGDPYWESYYWVQIYKIASATRADRPLIDNAGPWFYPTNWGATWWNLNVQLSYSPVYTANRLHLGETLVSHLHEHQENLILSVDEKYRHDSAGLSRHTGPNLLGWAGEPGGRPNMERGHDIGMETGNLLWTCHNLWLHYRHSMDEKIARDTLFPILRRAVNYHRHFLETKDDGKLHLPITHSPEYGNAPNANYDLSLLRWGAATLVDLNRTLKLDDPLLPKWEELLENLVSYPRDDKSYLIGTGVPYANSHRHWSHLMMIYPLLEIRAEDGHSEWIRSNLAHWHSHQGAHAGYSFTGGASIAAVTGDRERFVRMLHDFKRFIDPNTLYREGGRFTVMETPLHMACAIQEAFLQSHHEHLSIFPCVPEAWPNAAFHRFLAQGGHIVSAAMKDGKPAWVEIESPHGGSLVVTIPFASPPQLVSGSGGQMKIRDDGKIEITLAPGARCQITAAPAATYQIHPAPALPGDPNPFGLK